MQMWIDSGASPFILELHMLSLRVHRNSYNGYDGYSCLASWGWGWAILFWYNLWGFLVKDMNNPITGHIIHHHHHHLQHHDPMRVCARNDWNAKNECCCSVSCETEPTNYQFHSIEATFKAKGAVNLGKVCWAIAQAVWLISAVAYPDFYRIKWLWVLLLVHHWLPPQLLLVPNHSWVERSK